MKHIVKWVLSLLFFGLVALMLAVTIIVRGSLPQLDGSIVLAGLQGSITIERDDRGIPTATAGSRRDLAFATGFLHAQDRFFQMDLLRRSAAGELSELFGAIAVSRDRSVRLYRFRHVAGEVLALVEAENRLLIEAYVAGVNAGLDQLGFAPFEYFLLGNKPERWREEDSILVVFAMYLDLQDETASREAGLAVLQETLPEPVFGFLAGPGTRWDTPVEGAPLLGGPVPGPEVFDVRGLQAAVPDAALAAAADAVDAMDAAPGSNNWAVHAERSATGHAMVANDMHLDLNVPNVFYWLRLISDSPDVPLDITGTTLPGGLPIVTGSNGHIAWGYTNSYGDWSDLVIVEPDPRNPGRYLTADGFREFVDHVEIIHVRGSDDIEMTVRSTVWGPLLDEDHHGRRRAISWLPLKPEASNLGLLRMETARTVTEAVSIAHQTGIPAQNLVVADAEGNIAWTIIGQIPKRTGYDPMLPASWADAGVGWTGWVESDAYPTIINPEGGLLWTANSRVVGTPGVAVIGDGGFVVGSRARQIRDGLTRRDRVSIDDMLTIQLDDRAAFYEPWRVIALRYLDDAAVMDRPDRQEFRGHLVAWDGHARPDAVGFRLIRAFRNRMRVAVLNPISALARQTDPGFEFPRVPNSEEAVLRILENEPLHFLDPAFDRWSHLTLAVIDELLDYYRDNYLDDLANRTWGEINRVRISHPMSAALPFLSSWLDMPPMEMSGAWYMPRVQEGGFGASERMAVSPGKESDGYFHMPGGQSGHPLSPFYRAGHDDWALGRRGSFLPGATRHRLVLQPDG